MIPVTQPILAPAAIGLGSRLFKLDQRAAKILGVKKEYRLVVGAQPRLAISEHSCAFCAQPISSRDNVVHFIADVVHPARWIALQKAFNLRGCAERFEKLDPGIRK